jgi:hypothetical protein
MNYEFVWKCYVIVMSLFCFIIEKIVIMQRHLLNIVKSNVTIRGSDGLHIFLSNISLIYNRMNPNGDNTCSADNRVPTPNNRKMTKEEK